MIDLSDPISRQQAITALRALSDEDGYINVPHEVVTDVVRCLPPVQLKHEQTTPPERGETDKLGVETGETWLDVTCPNCGCEIHVEPERKTGGDTISRQAAIDILAIGEELLKRVLDDMDVVGYEREKYEWGLGLIESYISDMKDLPSAQQDIEEKLYQYKCYITDKEDLQHEVIHTGDIRRVTGWMI